MTTGSGGFDRCPECGHALTARGGGGDGIRSPIAATWSWIALVIVLSLTAGQGVRLLGLILLELRPGGQGLTGMLRVGTWWTIILSLHLLLSPVLLAGAVWGRHLYRDLPTRWQLGLLGAATVLAAADLVVMLLANW